MEIRQGSLAGRGWDPHARVEECRGRRLVKRGSSGVRIGLETPRAGKRSVRCPGIPGTHLAGSSSIRRIAAIAALGITACLSILPCRAETDPPADPAAVAESQPVDSLPLLGERTSPPAPAQPPKFAEDPPTITRVAQLRLPIPEEGQSVTIPPEVPGELAAARPAPNGARGFTRPPEDPAQATLFVPRLLLSPARLGLRVATLPVRAAGALLSPSGYLQRWARTVHSHSYLIPLAGVDPSLGTNVGLRAAHGNPLDSRGCVTYRLAYGGTREQLFALTLRSRDPYLLPYEDGWSYRLTARYEVIPDKHYFGLGNVSRRKDLTFYTLERYLFLGTLRYAPSRWMRWDFSLSAHRSQIRSGAYLDDEERSIEELFGDDDRAPGWIIDPQNIQAEVALVLDGRDERARPGNGIKVETFFAFAHGTGPDIVEFVWYGGELQLYRSLAPRHVLAGRLAAEEARSDTQAPHSQRFLPIKLTELPSLGGPTTLRGYLKDRYIENGAYLATLEYRYQVSPLVEACVFADFGKVLPRLLDFDFKVIHRSWGAGLRIASNEWMYLRLQGAASDEDVVLSASLESAFDRPDRRERR